MKKISISFPFVIIISIVIQLLGLVKSLYLANDFGADHMLDAFYLANVFTVSVFNVISAAITTIVIPELNNTSELTFKKKHIESYLSIIRLISLIICLGLFLMVVLFRYQIAPNFTSNSLTAFIIITGILLVSQQYRIQAAISVSIFQSESHYIIPRILDIIPAFIPVIYLFVSSNIDLVVLSILTGLSYIIETLVFNILQKKIDANYKFKFKISINSHVIKMLINTMPILLSSMVFQLQILISNYFAGYFGKGYITLLSNTNQIMGIFQSLFIMNLINMIYPKMVREIKNNFNLGISKTSIYISFIGALVILLIWGYIAVGDDLIKFIFVRGNFTQQNANTVFKFGIVLGIVLPIDVIRDFMYRIYYAKDDTSTPMFNSLLTVFINIVLLIAFSKYIGPYSIVVAPAIGTVISTLMIMAKTYKKGINVKIVKIIVAYAVANIVGFGMLVVIKVFGMKGDNLPLSLITNFLIGVTYTLCIAIFLYLVYKIIKNFNNK